MAQGPTVFCPVSAAIGGQPPDLAEHDAAGRGDYRAGEGIFSALESAGLAARQICRLLQGEAGVLTDCQARMDREITLELRASYQFSRIFNYIGLLTFRWLERDDYPGEVFCRIRRGDRSWGQIKNRLRPDIFIRGLLVKSAGNQPIT